jgi:hypothetical protein
MVMVEVEAVVPAMPTRAGLSEQVGVPLAPSGLEVTAQVRPMFPVKPPAGVAVMVEVPDEPATTETGVPARVKVGFATISGVTTVRPRVWITVPAAFLPVTRTL